MKLHHIGKVVSDLEKERLYYEGTFGLGVLEGPITDPIQQVDVLLIDMGYGDEVTLELIKPLGDKSPVARFLAKTGGGLHHLSYAVEDIDAAVAQLETQGAKALGRVVPSAAHKSPSIWLYTASRELIELIEKKPI